MFSMFKEMSLTFFWIINLTYFLSLVCAHTFCDFYKFNVNSGPEDNANKIQVRTKPNRNSPSPCIIFQKHFVQKRPLYVRKYKLHSLDLCKWHFLAKLSRQCEIGFINVWPNPSSYFKDIFTFLWVYSQVK